MPLTQLLTHDAAVRKSEEERRPCNTENSRI